MHGSFFFSVFTTFLLLSCTPTPLSCTTAAAAAILGRRLLSDPTSPPFFPFYPSTPPPPPPSFATFPANISALVLPRSPEPKPGSRKLLVPAISAVLSAATVAGLLFFIYRRWRGQDCQFADGAKSSDSDSSDVLCPPPNMGTRNTSNKLSVTGSSSEVLYLGNVVNSHSVEGDGYDRSDDPGLSSAKPESPEISPLPPLVGHNFKQNDETDASTEEEGEEFYSPMASLAGTERSSQPGYGYASGLGSVGQEYGATNVAYSTCSCSSSTSASPARSVSVTISPPMSSTLPQRSDRRDSDASSDQNPQSPALSLASQSPERGLMNNNRGGSLRMFSFWNRSAGLPRISSASTSPDRGMTRTPDGYARSSLYSSASTSPDGVFRKVLEVSMPKWNDFNRNVQSLLLSSNSASPGRESSNNVDNSNLNVIPPGKIPEFSRNKECISAPPPRPPPPPPPPPPLLQRQPLSSQTVAVPPPLMPPSQPFVVQRAGKSLSFSDLPSSSSEAADQPKPKLKPLHWDKVRATSSRRTAWDRLRSSSSRLNEEMIETLFVSNPTGSNTKQRTPSFDHLMLSQENRVLDPKKAQNVAILLKALNVTTEDVCQALLDGDADALGIELLESLSRMTPNKEEEQNLKDYKDDSPIKLGPAEKFLKKVLDVPFGFKRIDALLYVVNFDSEAEYLKRSFDILQAACGSLKNSRMFFKLLEAVLKTGNRMNVGTNPSDAHAFKLDTLLKLVDVKGADGKTSLLHFVLHEIVKSEGARPLDTVKNSNSSMNEEEDNGHCQKLGLQVVGNLSSELADVKKSADMDYDVIRSDVSKLSQGISKIKEVLQLNEEIGSNEEQRQKFRESMTRFLKTAEDDIKKIKAEESSTLSAVKEIADYFHGDSVEEEPHPFRIFVVVRDFLAILDRVCKELRMVRERRIFGSSDVFQF